MTKRELWEVFIKTGSVSDYLRYKKADDRQLYDSEDILTEISEEFSDSLTQDK